MLRENPQWRETPYPHACSTHATSNQTYTFAVLLYIQIKLSTHCNASIPCLHRDTATAHLFCSAIPMLSLSIAQASNHPQVAICYILRSTAQPGSYIRPSRWQKYTNEEGNRNTTVTTTQQMEQKPNLCMVLDLVGAQLQPLQVQEW